MKQKIFTVLTLFLISFGLITDVVVNADEFFDLKKDDIEITTEVHQLLHEPLYGLAMEPQVMSVAGAGVATGFATISAFMLANPFLALGLLILGLGAVAIGLKFNTFQEAYEFGRKVRNNLTIQAYSAAIKGYTLIMTSDVKKAMIRANNGLDWVTDKFEVQQNLTINHTMLNTTHINDDYDYIGALFGHDFNFDRINIDNTVDGIKMTSGIANGTNITIHTLHTNYLEVELWNSRKVLPTGISRLRVGSPDFLKSFPDFIQTERNGIKIRFDDPKLRYFHHVRFMKIKDTDPRVYFNQNMTFTFGDGSTKTFYGDVPENYNPYIPLDQYTNHIYPDETTVNVNPDFSIGSSGTISAKDIPNVLIKPDGYTQTDREFLGNLAIAAGDTVIDWDGSNPDGDDETQDDTDGNLLTWLMRIFNFLTKMLNPIHENVNKVGQNISTLADFIGAKFVTLDLYLDDKFGALSKSLVAIPGQVSGALDNLLVDAGAVWDGLADKLAELNDNLNATGDDIMGGIDAGLKNIGNSLADFRDDVAVKIKSANDFLADGIDAGVKNISDTLANVQDNIVTKTKTMTDSIAGGIDGINAKVGDFATSIADVLEWLKIFFVPDFAGIKATWINSLDLIKLKFKPLINVAASFSNVFSRRKSIYDLEIEIFDEKVRPVPITLKSSIDIFKNFATALCVLLTIMRAYRRFVGEGDAIAT